MKNFEDILIQETKNNINKNNKRLVIDIDGVVASIVANENYEKAKPIIKNIKLINKLKKLGYEIIFYTARGSVSGINWKEITVKQFEKWELKYDDLKFGKPAADLYIDDKAATPSILGQLIEKDIG